MQSHIGMSVQFQNQCVKETQETLFWYNFPSVYQENVTKHSLFSWSTYPMSLFFSLKLFLTFGREVAVHIVPL